MLVSVNGEKGTATMVTLLTKKLQDQSLSDLPCKAYSIDLHSEKLSQTVSLFPYELHEKSPWRVISGGCAFQREAVTQNATVAFPMCPYGGSMGEEATGPQTSASVAPGSYAVGGPSALPGWISELNLNENGGPPLAPPTKRHCRSLSEPDELARCRSPWRPGSGSKIWTPISKRRCNSGGAASLQRCHSHGNAGLPQPPSSSCSSSSCSSGCGRTLALHGSALAVAVSPVPRPSSASSGFADGGEGSSGTSSTSSTATPWHSAGPRDHTRRLSLSQEHIADVGGCMGALLPSASSTPSSTPELCRRQGLLRCRSQPCVLQERKSGLKRRREEDVRWSRPSLDFLKMTRTLKNSKSLCSLDYEDDEDPQGQTIVSSPCDSEDLLSDAGAEPAGRAPVLLRLGPRPGPPHPHLRTLSSAAAVSESDEDADASDCESAEDTLFPLDCADLDLEQIENN